VKGTPGIDDFIIVFAWVRKRLKQKHTSSNVFYQIALVALGVVTYIAVDYGYGRKSAALTRAEASNAIRVSTAHESP